MRRKLVCVILAAVLLVGSIGTVFALESPAAHWAQADIDRVLELGLFTAEDGDFRPDDPMTRAMFVTALGRLAEVDPQAWPCDTLPLLFTDVDAEAFYAPYLSWAVYSGILGGVGDRLFCPDEPITREQLAQGVTNWLILGGITLEEAEPVSEDPHLPLSLPADASASGEPDPTEAAPSETLAVLLPDGTEDSSEPTASASEAAEETPAPPSARSGLSARVKSITIRNATREMRQHSKPSLETEAYLMGRFIDADAISEWARVGVCLLSSNDLISGIPDASGGMRFAPQEPTTRGECAVLFCRLVDRMAPGSSTVQEPSSLLLNTSYIELTVGRTTNIAATVFPLGTANTTVIWYAEDPEIAAVDIYGYIQCLSPGSTVIHALTSNRIEQCCVLVVNELPEEPEETPEEETPEELQEEPIQTPDEEAPTDEPAPEDQAPIDDTPPAEGLGSASMTDHEKDMMIFGQDVDDPRLFYANDDVALSHQVSLTVKTWDLAADGTKYTRSWGLQVHENLAATVLAIFDEIYNSPDKPVIHSMGGWRPNAGKSEHQPGLAVDLNWLENAFYAADGSIITGYYYKPGEDPYSIPIGGTIDQIFNKYGFTRGIYWQNGKRDYMHYSFYGT